MATTAASPISISRWIPSLPSVLMNPFGGEADSSKKADDGKDSSNANGTSYRPSKAHQQTQGESRPPAVQSAFSFAASEVSQSPSRTSENSFFAEPETTASLSAGSREGSLDGRRALKTKPKTKFSLCHPPPESRTRQRLHRRPRSLLQLHRIRDAARPLPAFDIIPSTNFSLTLNAAITRVFKTKHGLHPSDVVVLKAEKYNMSGDEGDEDTEARDVIGLICSGRKEDTKVDGGKASIIMADGKEWEAYNINNGGYEFHSDDKNGLGLTVRWVPKRNKDGSNVGKDGLRRFNFSTISPNSRRHPIIASLTKTALDINDTYKLPDPTATTPAGTPQKAGFLEDAMESEPDKRVCETDHHLRQLITMTSIFVTFKEGWSPSFKFHDDKEGLKSPPSSPPKHLGSPMLSQPGSPALLALEKRTSIKSISSGIFRRPSKTNRHSLAISVSSDDHTPSRSSSINTKPGRTRADSASTVLVHRAASNRRKNNTQQWRPELLGAQTILQETSRESSERENSRAGTPARTVSPLAARTVPALPVSHSRESSVTKKGGHRESVATGDTTPLPSPMVKGKKGKKVRWWRRPLCGSRH